VEVAARIRAFSRGPLCLLGRYRDRRLPRLNSGSLHCRVLADGSRVFRLRFNADGRRQIMSLRERRGCECGCGGGWDEPAARRELAETVARIRLGAWKRPTSAMRARRAGSGTSFQDYARQWLAAKTEGTYGEIRAGTAAAYRCSVELHLLPVFGECFVEEIDRAVPAVQGAAAQRRA
jgi:hypothetical protein